MFSPMPGWQYTVLWIVTVVVGLGIVVARRGWLQGIRGFLWIALGAVVSATLIAALAFRIGDVPPAGSKREVILTPFEGLKGHWMFDAPREQIANFYGNIALFVPLGIVLAFLLHGWLVVRLATAGAMGAALSGVIELTQTTMDGRTSDINDIILNGSGAVLGAAIGCFLLVVSRIGKAVDRRCEQTAEPIGSEV